MIIQISSDLNKELRKIKNKDKQLTKKIEKQLCLFQQNHLHPSLHLHKLAGKMNNIWSISIDRNYRMVYFLFDNEAYFFDIGTHDQIYKN